MENSMILEMQFPETKIRDIVTSAIKAEFEARFPKENKLIARITAAKRIGVSVVTFDTRAKEGLFKTQKIGGKVFITEAELNKLIEGSRFGK